MTRPPRIPDIWQNLRPGEQFFSRWPFHRLQEAAALMPDRAFTFLPATGGYFVKCERLATEPAVTEGTVH